MEHFTIIILGVCCIILGVRNYQGKHIYNKWYNRKKVSEKVKIKYGKIIGLGIIIIGLTIILSAFMQIVYHSNYIWYFTFLGLAIGLIIILYAQIKYNKSI